MKDLPFVPQYDDPEFKEAICKLNPKFKHPQQRDEYIKYAQEVVLHQNQVLLRDISDKIGSLNQILATLTNKLH